MSHGHSSNAALPPDTSRRHELSDAHAGGIVVFSICMAVTLAVVVVITLGLFYLFTDFDPSHQAEFASSPLVDLRSPSPAPPLQPSKGHETLPFQDAITLRAEYDRLAGTYGDDTMADHAVHQRIPVEAAIGLMASDGVPSNTATDIPAPQGPAQSVPTPYSEGGRGSKTDTAAAPGVPGQ